MSVTAPPTYRCLLCGRVKKILPLMPRLICNDCHTICDERVRRKGALKRRIQERKGADG